MSDITASRIGEVPAHGVSFGEAMIPVLLASSLAGMTYYLAIGCGVSSAPAGRQRNVSLCRRGDIAAAGPLLLGPVKPVLNHW